MHGACTVRARIKQHPPWALWYQCWNLACRPITPNHRKAWHGLGSLERGRGRRGGGGAQCVCPMGASNSPWSQRYDTHFGGHDRGWLGGVGGQTRAKYPLCPGGMIPLYLLVKNSLEANYPLFLEPKPKCMAWRSAEVAGLGEPAPPSGLMERFWGKSPTVLVVSHSTTSLPAPE